MTDHSHARVFDPAVWQEGSVLRLAIARECLADSLPSREPVHRKRWRPAGVLLGLTAIVTGPPVAASSAPADLGPRVDAYVHPYVASNNFSGCLLIARGSDVLLRRCYGEANRELAVPNTPRTRFHVASVSKSFTAAAVLLLEQRGKLRVEDPLSRFIPDYPRGEEITLHHLLTHSSGIPNVNQFPDYEEKSRQAWPLDTILSWFKPKPLEFEPGTRYGYSNSNYNLLAFVIEKASGESYGEVLRRHLLEPAGLRDTGHDGEAAALIPGRASGYVPEGLRGVANAPYLDWSIKTGNGSLYSTVDDLYRWDRALRSGRVLSDTSLRKAFTEHFEGVGYGWFIRTKAPRRSVAINGRSPGFSANLERFVEEDVVVAMTSNLYSSITETMAADLGALALGEARRPVLPSEPLVLPPQVLQRYVGRYQFGADFRFNPKMVGEVIRGEDGLALVSGGGGGTSFLIPLAEDRFLDRLYGGTVTFRRDGDGAVRELVWNFGDDYVAPRIDSR